MAAPAPPRTARLVRRVLLALVCVVVLIFGFEAASRMLSGSTRTKKGPAVAALDSKKAALTPITAPMPPQTTTPATHPGTPTQPDPGNVVTYEQHVASIFAAKCVSCHGAVKPKGSYDMRALNSILKGGVSGPGLKPGVLQDSILWMRIEDNSMPPGKNDKLTDREKQLVQQWIAGGARSSNAVAQKP